MNNSWWLLLFNISNAVEMAGEAGRGNSSALLGMPSHAPPLRHTTIILHYMISLYCLYAECFSSLRPSWRR